MFIASVETNVKKVPRSAMANCDVKSSSREFIAKYKTANDVEIEDMVQKTSDGLVTDLLFTIVTGENPSSFDIRKSFLASFGVLNDHIFRQYCVLPIPVSNFYWNYC